MVKRTTPEKVLLSLSFLATVTIAPFMLLRWFNGDITLAVVNGIISLTAISFFFFIYNTRKVDVAQKLFALFLAFGVMVTTYLRGESQILWAFPAIIAIYYLMPLKLARNTSVILVGALSVIIYSQVDFVTFFSISATTALTAALSFVIFRSYHEKQHELSLLASIDALTSSGNRRALDHKLCEVIASQQREAATLCLILLDLDEFKEINDNHGHAVGDQVLITVCELITEHTRVLDTLYRFGGDEFIIMPLKMSLDTAKALAEKIRTIIEQHIFVNGIKLTLSIGVAEYKENDSLDSWITRADEALYKAKENGKNSVF